MRGARGTIEGMIVIVMGVSGSGKTTVGRRLAEELGWLFYDADAFHSQSNVQKMRAGIPLTDIDRGPWLDALRVLIDGCAAQGRDAVIACSALRKAYRQRLRAGRAEVRFVYLKGDRQLIERRVAARRGHFASPALLDSQFAALEEPAPVDSIHVDLGLRPEQIVPVIRAALRR